jgi:hypothetical protein
MASSAEGKADLYQLNAHQKSSTAFVIRYACLVILIIFACINLRLVGFPSPVQMGQINASSEETDKI